ncbi:MAG: hypothetical protein RIQ52_1766 [Pseudomonadota bacterium]|jgi:uncharacterized membrane protein YgdD (TMEM256/DUF423 family)
MNRCLVWAAVAGFTGVALGAFGAHGLKAVLSPQDMQVYQTAVHYQMIHALLGVAIGILSGTDRENRVLIWSGRLVLTGLVLFPGSLYLLLATGQRSLGMVTPLGGTAWLGAWLLLALYGWRHGQSSGTTLKQ